MAPPMGKRVPSRSQKAAKKTLKRKRIDEDYEKIKKDVEEMVEHAS